MKNPHTKSTGPAGQFLEALEQRIAPAGLNEANITAAPTATSFLLTAGHGISTADSGGNYLLYVEQGQAMVFTTDLNANNRVDPGEISGIAAGDGLKLLSFVDINGDIVTNLRSDGHLTDSDGDASNGYDGKIVLNSHIQSITLRSVTESDLNPALFDGNNTPHDRVARSNYSIYGNIYAGGGIGSETTPGVLIDTSGFVTQAGKFTEPLVFGDLKATPTPSIGHIYTGDSVGGKMFSFGTSPLFGNEPGKSLRGTLSPFVPSAGQSGGDVIGVNAGTAQYYIAGIQTGNGGFGANGGDIRNVKINGDIGTLEIIAGDGGKGVSGGNGGSVLNFSALNSETTLVAIQTGDGGFGLLGTAGKAGQVSFSTDAVTTTNADGTTTTTTTSLPVALYGFVNVGLGKGGDALGNAGDGTTVASGKFNCPEIGVITPTVTLSTTRLAGDFDRPRAFDFNSDGFSDVVYLTDNPSQLAVRFGDGDGGFLSDYQILDASSYAPIGDRFSPVAVADFNGDGLMDIVTASSGGDTFTGVKVFINRGIDPLHAGDSAYWLGFDDARYSAIPNGNTAGAVTNLVTGDFNRDGVTDIGLVAHHEYAGFWTELVMLSGLKGADGKADGFFAADFGKVNTTINSVPTTTVLSNIADEGSFIVKATATFQGDNLTDAIMFLGRTGAFTDPSFPEGAIGVFRMTDVFGDPADPTKKTGEVVGMMGMGKETTPGVDPVFTTNGFISSSYTTRSVDDKGNWDGYDTSNAFDIRDFAIVDANGDGYFDPVIIGSCGQGVAAAVWEGYVDGTGTTVLKQPLNSDTTAPHTGNYFGVLVYSTNGKFSPVLGKANPTVYAAISTSPGVDGSNAFGFSHTTTGGLIMQNMVVNGFSQAVGNLAGAGTVATYSVTGAAQTQTILSDIYYPVTATPASDVYQGMRYDNVFKIWSLEMPTDFYQLAPNRLLLTAGVGGSSLLGAGGKGGSIGAGSVTFDADGVYVSASIETNNYDAATLTTGKGGSGFTAGGSAGSFSGVRTMIYSNPEAPVMSTLTASSGGSAMLGTGGSGGGFSQMSVNALWNSTAEYAARLTLDAGDGGFGLTGGAGGDLSGRGTSLTPDAGGFRTFELFAGHGGVGMNTGGKGGSINSFVNFLKADGTTIYGPAFLASYTAGDGGDAVSGTGGAGGSIVNVTPSTKQMFLTGNLLINGGSGGNGMTGGAGGDVSSFILTETEEYSPSSAFVLAGDGGDGVLGNGGRGGDLTNVTVTSKGAGYLYNSAINGSVINPETGTPYVIQVSKFVAGEGGVGAASAGGAGGSLNTINSTATAGAVVAIAGDGGAGFKAGGAGGHVGGGTQLNTSGLDDGRIVVFAGDGGNATAVTLKQIVQEASALPIYQGIIAMGAVNGTGGQGGSISNFSTASATQTSTDLTAGNGGSTLHWGLTTSGRPGTQAPGVGNGGSLTGISIYGDVGKMATDVAIKSYAANFTTEVRSLTAITQITDSTGNVGAVVGNKGFVRSEQTCAGGSTGSVSNFSARNIMSMVAGSVDRLAAISSISGLSLQNGGTTIGAYKNTPVAHDSNAPVYYAGPNGTGSEIAIAQAGGSLMDGAVLTQSWSGNKPQSLRIFVG